MNEESRKTLEILTEISAQKDVTQRDISTRLGIALGLTNSFIKRLVKKGYLKIARTRGNRCLYMLTSKGMMEKTRLTYEYISASYRYYRDARQNIAAMLGSLREAGARKVVFYGAGELAEIAYLSLQEARLELAGVVNPNGGGRFLGHKVLPPSGLEKLDYDVVLVTMMPGEFAGDGDVSRLVPPEKIVRIV